MTVPCHQLLTVQCSLSESIIIINNKTHKNQTKQNIAGRKVAQEMSTVENLEKIFDHLPPRRSHRARCRAQM